MKDELLDDYVCPQTKSKLQFKNDILLSKEGIEY